MGEVYRADDLELGQSVALKFLPDRFRHDVEALARFRTEVRLARQIAHPNIARVYDIAEVEGQVFLTMEYVDGEDLASVLRRMGRPSSDKAVDIARQLCLGLAAAHERGVLHRDLKPSNVMIDGRGRVRIMDFGLAAVADDDSGDRHIVGTPAYMAPEQLARGQVSVQSDLYALGLVLYEVCTGRRAHETNDPEEIKRLHESGSAPTPTSVVGDLDPVFERVIRRCLETEPRLRPPSAYAVLGSLPGGDPLAAALAAGETPSPDLVANARDTGGMSAGAVLALAGAAIALILLALWLATPLYRPFRQAPAALFFRSSALLESFGYSHLPRHTAYGFGRRSEVVARLAKRKLPGDSLATAAPGGLFFWSRYSESGMDPVEIHANLLRFNDPPLAGAGSIAVALDRDGRLLGVQVTPKPGDDTTAAIAPGMNWMPALAAAGYDTAQLVADGRRWAAPVPCDTTAAWMTPAPKRELGTLRVRAGALRGRLVYFAVVDSLGSALGGLEPRPFEGPHGFGDWAAEILNWAVVGVAIFLARRNLAMGRVDHRGAFRLGAFVFVATAMETVFTMSIPQRGFSTLLDSLLGDRALGHALLHAGQMWVYYVALEPYVRRLWPRMLVSWARLSGGRLRDPMVGRDALAGVLLGAAAFLVLRGATIAAGAFHWPAQPSVLPNEELAALASMGGLGFTVSYYCSVMVLSVLQVVVTCLGARLLVRREVPTIVLAVLVTFASSFPFDLPALGLAVAIVNSLVWPLLVVSALFRFGLLTALVAVFVNYMLGSSPPPFDPSLWYGARGLVCFGLLAGLAGFAAWTALAGQPLFADVLQEKPSPGA
jgi:serine/threonine-protein kinase